MNTKTWTLNADVGEGCDDRLIMPFLDCANVGCGKHAGSEAVTQATIDLAKQFGVTVGAHPGYADPENFGRFSLNLSDDALRETLREQIGLMNDLCTDLMYVKPHGALNHDMLANDDIFKIICEVMAEISPHSALMVPTNSKQAEQITIAKASGLSIWWEVFADRAYEPSGLLRPRKYEDAVHNDPQAIIAQIQRIREAGEIVAIDGSVLDISHAKTICVHGDNQASVEAIQQLVA